MAPPCAVNGAVSGSLSVTRVAETVTLEHSNWLRWGSFEGGHGAQCPQPAMSERPMLWG